MLQTALGLRERLQVYGTDYPTPDGTALRDYIHVCDLADAHVKAAERLATDGGSAAYNLGSQRGYSVLEVIEAARRVTGKPIPVSMETRRSGDPARLVASSAKARTELGWAPQYGLEEIVASAWRWHSMHPHGYEAR